MTRREKTLGSVLVSLIVVSLCVFGAEAYFARLHALDAKLARAERRISEAGLASRANSDPSKLRKNWTPAEIDSAAFLSQFASIARGAGWQVLATIQRGSKNKVLSYSVDLEGRARSLDRSSQCHIQLGQAGGTRGNFSPCGKRRQDDSRIGARV